MQNNAKIYRIKKNIDVECRISLIYIRHLKNTQIHPSGVHLNFFLRDVHSDSKHINIYICIYACSIEDQGTFN